jgi:hypothetical protein
MKALAFWECSFHFLFVSAVRNALDFPPPEVIFLFHNTWDDIPKSASKSKPKSMSNVM